MFTVWSVSDKDNGYSTSKYTLHNHIYYLFIIFSPLTLHDSQWNMTFLRVCNWKVEGQKSLVTWPDSQFCSNLELRFALPNCTVFFFMYYVKFLMCCYDIAPEVDQFIKKKKMMDMEPDYSEIGKPHRARGLAVLVHGRDGRASWHVTADCRR